MMEKLYYTAKEAMTILGMTYSALQNQVDADNLHPVTPPGRRQKVYPKEEVDELKREMDAWFISRKQAKTPSAKFVRATAQDMPQAVALSDAIFGGVNIIPLEKRIEWLEKNPEIDYFLKQENQVVGYVSLVPLRPETIDDLLKKRRFAKELTADDILTYEPGVPVDIYGMAIGGLPGVSLGQKRVWGERLIMGVKDVLLDFARRGIVIRSIKAHSTKPDGIRLLKHLGFTETEASFPGMRDFVVEVEPSGLPFLLEYKKVLRQWQQDHSTEE